MNYWILHINYTASVPWVDIWSLKTSTRSSSEEAIYMFASGASPSPNHNWDTSYNMWSVEFHHFSVWYTYWIDSQKKVTNEVEIAIQIPAPQTILFWWIFTTFFSTCKFLYYASQLENLCRFPRRIITRTWITKWNPIQSASFPTWQWPSFDSKT